MEGLSILRLRVVTFNTHHGEDLCGRDAIAAAGALLRGLDADVIALQEVDRFWARSGGVDQVARHSRELGMPSVFAAALALPSDAVPGRGREYGSLLLSPHPIIRRTRTMLPTPADEEPRCMLTAILDVAGEAVTVAATHLAEDAGTALAQAEALSWQLPAARGILLGDLNAGPDSAVLDVLARAGYRDRIEEDTPTYLGEPAERIDHILTTPDIAVAHAAVHTGDDGISDHRPVWADLLLP